MYPVILAGGNGTRLWPLSRSSHPKQFLPLAGDKTMLQMTLTRLEGVDGVDAPVVVCNEDHRFLVAEQLRDLGVADGQIVLEPFGRNTAPAIAIAAMVAQENDPEALLMVLPADHLIPDTEAFSRAVASAREAANAGALVTFGIVPTRAETGYGYIRSEGDGSVRAVNAFVEKPDQPTAESYLASGDYYWNSGMFVFKAERILQELQQHAPEIYQHCLKAYQSTSRDLDFIRLDNNHFANCPSTSIDYAVMERTGDAVVVPLDAGWSDLGSWDALQDVESADGNGNVLKGDVIASDTTNSYIRAEQRLVATIGLENCIVVETADAVLIADRSRSQDVKKVVDHLKAAEREEHAFHRRVHRPWGHYEGITQSERFQVKHIVVKPGAALSLQLHHHRAEHWVVVKGTARITCGDDVKLFREDQSNYIPVGTAHRLENPGKIPLELIEVQTGSYLGEDDIVRIADRYRRAPEQEEKVSGAA